MALTTRKTSTALTNPSKATRQQIPPFLSKLYHMVNDPDTDNLIRWSDAGDSFYVYDHERFAKEVLPHWFKHGNFGSFVRQLNNYGFHKVPHLQQGVLRSDGEAEISHFENQYFQREQPDLLCLIQRKKQSQMDAREDSPTDFKEPVVGATAQANGAESDSTHSAHNIKGAVLDISSVVNGIQAIKRHQHAISAELKELHQSNQSLWQEAFAARERHKKHHDTITRILKFLAGVFGQNANGSPRAPEVPHSSPDKGSANSTMVPRRGNLLMIENGGKDGGSIVEALNGGQININDFMEPLDFEGGQAHDGERFATIETPASPSRPARPSPAPSTVSTKPADAQSIAGDFPTPDALLSPPATTPNPVPTLNGFPFSSSNHNRLPSTDTQSMFDTNLTSTSVPTTTTTVASTSSGPTNDTIASILSNPTHLHRVLSAINSVPMPLSMPGDAQSQSPGMRDGSSNSHPFFSSFRPPPDGQLSPGSTLSLLNAATGMGTLSISPPSDDATTLNALAQNSSQLQNTYKDASDIEADVNNLQANIDSLIESFGLDANTAATLRGENILHADDDIVSSVGPSTGTIPAPQQYDNVMGGDTFDFDAFLLDPHNMHPQTDFNTMQNGADRIGAFLDEVRSVSNDSEVTAPTPESTIGGGLEEGDSNGKVGVGGKKRKSDVVELVPEGKPAKAPRISKKR